MSKKGSWQYAPLTQYEVKSEDNDLKILVENENPYNKETDVKSGGNDFRTLVDDNEPYNKEAELEFHERNSKSFRSTHISPVKGLKSRTKLEKIFFFIILVLLIVLIAVLARNYKSSTVCVSRDCIEIASRVSSSLDETVDPCQDFYQFSCGGWKNKHPLPSGHSKWSTFGIMSQENQAFIKSILETNSTSGDPAETKAKRLYNSCLDISAIEKVGTKPLLDLIKKMGGWDVLGNWNKTGFDFNRTLKQLQPYSGTPFFDFGVGTDSKNSTSRIIQIAGGGLIAGSRTYYLNKSVTEDKVLSAHLEYMTTVAVLLGADHNTSSVSMLEILNLEKKLAIILPSMMELRDPVKNYNKMTLGSLKNLAPAVDWLNLIPPVFKDDANITVGEDEPVLVPSLGYFKNFSSIIYETDERIIHNYLMWTLVSSCTGILGQAFRDAAIKVDKVTTGADQGCIERWRSCVNNANGVFGKEVGRLFVQQKFNIDNKQSAETMVDSIKDAFYRNLNTLTWMDDATKALAHEKAKTVVDLIGFSKKILNLTYINEYYKELSLPTDGTYFDYNIEIYRFYVRKQLSKLRKPISRWTWGVEPTTINAFYSPTKNTIVFPAGILQPPFYAEKAPFSLNFGAMGVVVGHELTHGFDDQGSRYDNDGNLKNWWGSTTFKQFQERAECMKKQYSEYTMDGYHINGNITIGENIADNGGLKLAYNAYKEWERTRTDFQLPSLNYSNDQLFFIGFAQIWCSAVTPEYTRNQVISNVHSPSPTRVIGTMSNSKEFSKAFKCPLGSPMNPHKKCALW